MKNFSVRCRTLFVLCVVVLAASCSDDDSDPAVVKSSAKAITSFKFATPAATGVIAESDKKIAVTFPAGTDVTALVPTIVVSEKATVTPNTGVKQDFTKPVSYTVTAEDGSKQAYVVTVSVDDEPVKEITVTAISANEIQAGAEFYLQGTNFAGFANSAITITNIDTEEETTLSAKDNSTATKLYFTLPVDLAAGEYSIVVTSGSQTVEVDFTAMITPAPATITNISVTQVDQGGQVVIEGFSFSETGNEVRLIDANGYSYGMDILSESSTSITFVAETPYAAVFRVAVYIQGGDEAASEIGTLTVGTPPEIVAINKTTFARGEQIILTGQGLKVDGISPFLYFMPDAIENDFRQGVGKVNDAGTEITYTIPTGWAADSYELTIDYDGNTIKKFQIVIQ